MQLTSSAVEMGLRITERLFWSSFIKHLCSTQHSWTLLLPLLLSWTISSRDTCEDNFWFFLHRPSLFSLRRWNGCLSLSFQCYSLCLLVYSLFSWFWAIIPRHIFWASTFSAMPPLWVLGLFWSKCQLVITLLFSTHLNWSSYFLSHHLYISLVQKATTPTTPKILPLNLPTWNELSNRSFLSYLKYISSTYYLISKK